MFEELPGVRGVAVADAAHAGVAGDQHVLAEDFFFQRGAGAYVDVPGQAQVFGLVAGQFPGDDPPDPGLSLRIIAAQGRPAVRHADGLDGPDCLAVGAWP